MKLGLDVYYHQVTVATQEDGGRIKAAGKMGHEIFQSWAQKKLQESWQIYSCYEAGASGYRLHRDLVKMGVKKPGGGTQGDGSPDYDRPRSI